MRKILFLLLICSVAFASCGKKKEEKSVLSEIQQKQEVKVVKASPSGIKKPAQKEEDAAPKFIDNSTNLLSTDIPDAPLTPSTASETVMESLSTTTAAVQEASEPAEPAPTQQTGYVVPAQKVDPNAPPPAPPKAPAPYPPYQGYQQPPQGGYTNPYGAPPPSSYRGYPPPPPKKYVAPGPLESTGEFIGHLVNPFKRKEDESKKEYKGI